MDKNNVQSKETKPGLTNLCPIWNFFSWQVYWRFLWAVRLYFEKQTGIANKKFKVVQRMPTVSQGFNGFAAFFHTPNCFFLLQNGNNSILKEYSYASQMFYKEDDKRYLETGFSVSVSLYEFSEQPLPAGGRMALFPVSAKCPDCSSEKASHGSCSRCTTSFYPRARKFMLFKDKWFTQYFYD